MVIGENPELLRALDSDLSQLLCFLRDLARMFYGFIPLVVFATELANGDAFSGIIITRVDLQNSSIDFHGLHKVRI